MWRSCAPLLLCAALVACGSQAQSTPSHAVPTPKDQPHGSAVVTAHPTKILLVVEENHTAASALRGMPSLAAAAHRYGYATNDLAVAHPSLPNYLALAGGSTFGVTDDNGPASHHITGVSLFDQALNAGKSARTYVEDMGSNCQLSSSGTYAVKHNPWAYFSDMASRTECDRFDVPAGSTTSGALARDVTAGRLPTVGMLVPNLCHDAHDCSLATADSWLKQWTSVIMSGADWSAGRLALVVTFDENDDSSPNRVLTVVVAKRLNHVVARTSLTHYSWTRYADELLGARPLRDAVTASSLKTAFGL
ncbi:MAG: putative hydrolase [Frankiales bacterium]|nr:putative hydrolase [Frankiales bacterium]